MLAPLVLSVLSLAAGQQVSRGQAVDVRAKLLMEGDGDRIAERLAADEAVVVFARYRHSQIVGGTERFSELFHAVVVRLGRDPMRVELGGIEAVEKAVSNWRAALQAKQPDFERERESGDVLRALVFDPLRPALAEARRLVIFADDVLHLVPLESLSTGASFVGDEFETAYRNDLAELLQGLQPSASGPLMLVGNVDFDAQDGARAEGSSKSAPAPSLNLAAERSDGPAPPFAHLPACEREVAEIAELYEKSFGADTTSIRLEGTAATKSALVEHAQGARFLHIATHGWYSEALPESVGSTVRGFSPLDMCGMPLASANALGEGAGAVTGEELAKLDLAGCELAVLSASDGAAGLSRGGGGVASLASALRSAGARSVVASLWDVRDEAARELAVEFYRRLWIEKESKPKALWNARMSLRVAKDEHGRPRYATRDWAPWVLIGDAR